ncbi:hypothetical protein BSKO_12662 [Bryopsis sp. KO-2023]|nr:hypothetical protein BSKO_12662 [Bryopsis sp. KO-2023]
MNYMQIEHLKQRIQESKYDIQSWEALLNHYRSLPNTHQHFLEKQDVFEELLTVFPTAAGFWKAYAEAAMSVNDHTTVKSIFSRCLLNCLNVDLWNTYLRFIKKVNERKGLKGVPEVKQAFEFTLERVGQDINAGAIYQEFLGFLQNPKPGNPAYRTLYSEEGVPGQEDAHRIAILRKYYQKAVSVPTHHLDALWKAYENFEKSGTNKVLGRKLLEDMRSRYMSARRVYQERKRRLDDIRITALAVPPGDAGQIQHEQILLWQQYLEFEKSNPQRLDPQTLVSRVSLAYDQALMCLVHHPEIWNDYSRFHLSTSGGGSVSAVKVLDRARVCLPTCLMLHFAMADIEEQEGHIEKAKDVYEELVKCVEAKEQKPPQGEGEPQNNNANNNGNTTNSSSSKGKEKFAGVDLSDQAALVWITYMRFLRRVENVKTSRELFIRATKTGNNPWPVYVSAALLEWRSSKEQQVAVRIFEKGMTKFLDVPQFVLQYIDFLLGIGDMVNARAVFERALAREPCEKSQAMWEKYIQVLYEIGDLKQSKEVEERYRAAMGDTTPNGLHTMMARYKFLGVWPTSPGNQTVHMKRVLGMLPPPPTHLPVPQPMAPRGQPADMRGQSSGVREEPLKLPPALGNFINKLPPIQGGEGPVPDVDRVLNVLMRTDLSPASVSQKCVDPSRESSRKKSHTSWAGDDMGGRKRKAEQESEMYPRQWEPSMDEYRMRMRRKRNIEQQQAAAAKAATKSSRNGLGGPPIEVP